MRRCDAGMRLSQAAPELPWFRHPCAYHPPRAHCSPNTAHFCAPHMMQRSSGGGEGHGVKDGAARAAPGAGEFRGAAQARGEPQARVAVRQPRKGGCAFKSMAVRASLACVQTKMQCT